MARSLFLIIVLAALFDSCSTDMKTCTQQIDPLVLSAVDQAKLTLDVLAIDAYLAANSITAIKDGAMRYVISTPGTGQTPCLESSISVTYTGRLMANPTAPPFDSAISPVTFQLNSLIIGWRLGFLKLSKGAIATLYIPSGYAYGKNAQTGIPANSNLIFEVSLADFIK